MLYLIMTRGYLLFTFFLLSVIVNAQHDLKDFGTKIDSAFGHFDTGVKPGLSIAIIDGDKPVFQKSYGHANLEYGIKNSSETLFNATDLAKQFTVFSILMLEDQGVLSIHDDIKMHLPLLSNLKPRITLKHLMEQTSGLRDVMDLKQWTGYQNGDVITKQDILDVVSKQRQLNFHPGGKFDYCRTGFVLLTEVIAKVSGMTFSEFVKQNIFAPLSMNKSVFANHHDELIPNRSYSYDTIDSRYVKISNNSSFVGGTNLYTTSSDFIKWLRNMSKQSIGKPSFYEYMHNKVKLFDGQLSNYTPGIFKDKSDGYERIHLEGFDHGYTGYMAHMPEQDFSMVYFSNDNTLSIDVLYDVFYSWYDTENTATAPVDSDIVPSVQFVIKPASELQSYVGNYLFEDNFSLREIAFENDTLFYVRSETNRTPIVPIKGDHAFKMLVPGDDNVRVAFKDEGGVLEFRVINPGTEEDYVNIGRKLNLQNGGVDIFLGEYLNEEIDHRISIGVTEGKLQLTIDGVTIGLDQIGDVEFLSQGNSEVKYAKFEKNDRQIITGVSLSGDHIKGLYYDVVER